MLVRSELDNAIESNNAHLRDLQPSALLNLTARIESNLKKPSNEGPTKARQVNSRSESRKTKAIRVQPVNEALKLAAVVGRQRNVKTLPQKQDHVKPLHVSQGNKDHQNGHIENNNHHVRWENDTDVKLDRRTKVYFEEKDISPGQDAEAVRPMKDDAILLTDLLSDSEMEGEREKLANNTGTTSKEELRELIHNMGTGKNNQKVSTETSASGRASQQQIQECRTPLNGPHSLRYLKVSNSGPQKSRSMGKGHDGRDKQNQLSSANVEVLKQISNSVKPARQKTRPSLRDRNTLIFQPRTVWHTAESYILPASSQDLTLIPLDLLDRIHEYAQSLLTNDNMNYIAHNRSASTAHQFYSTIMSTGTLSDKISALTLSVQESPLHNKKALESLIGLARKRNRGQAVEVLGALKDLFGPGNLLPSDRKLKSFASQPALSANFGPESFQWTSKDPLPQQLKEAHLVVWAYEDWLKQSFFELLQILEIWCNDEVLFARSKALDYVCSLLKEKPEQEANLLRLLVNKVGDTEKKIASRSSFHILQLEATHPLMKSNIIAAIESDILFRPGQTLHAKYYATITLNQTVLSSKESRVAKKLLEIYFGLFIKLLENPEKEKHTATGINVIPVKKKNRKGELQGGGGPAGKRARKKLAEKHKITTNDEDIREKMLSAVLTGVNRAMPFAIANDETFEKHLDTLFRVTHSSNFSTSIQALMLIQQLISSQQGSEERFYRTLYESLLDPRLLNSSKQALYLNLVFRALRSDLNIRRVKAFTKRLLQVVAMHQPPFTCGSLYLIRELESLFADLASFVDEPEHEDSDDEEDFQDVQEHEINNRDLQRDPSSNAQFARSVRKQQSPDYDGRKRDPEYSNADRSSLWEIAPFLLHYHPAVSLFAHRLITHDSMPPKPDLSMNTLIHFLDRFVYRNPKKTNAPKGASIMQPKAGGDSSALLVSAYSKKSNNRQPVNSEAFWKQESANVNADEVFFHKYFSTLDRGKEKAKKMRAEKKKSGDISDDEEGDDEIWKALVESRPELDKQSEGEFSDDDLGSEMDDPEDEDSAELVDHKEKQEDAGANVDSEEEWQEAALGLDDEGDGALLESDEELPSDLDRAFQTEVWSGKRKEHPLLPEKGEKRSKKRRRLKSLPTFASAEDYAKILDGDD